MKKIIIPLVVGLMISCDQVHEMSQSVDEMVVQMTEAQHQLSLEMTNAPPGATSARGDFSRHSLIKNADWQHAFYQDLSFGRGLLVPVKFDQEIYYKANSDKITLPISALTYLFFYKTEKKKIHLEVITSLPSFDEQDTTFQKFKGTLGGWFPPSR